MKESGMFEKKMTVLFPDYKDNHIRQIVEDFMSAYPQIDCEYIGPDTEVNCSKLIFVPSVSIAANHTEILSPTNFVIPGNVTDRIQKYLVNPLIKNIKDMPSKPLKIYLVRRGGRNLTNYQEVEQYFEDNNFILVEPHLVSLEEKVRLFYNAEIIVGPLGTALANLIFCRAQTKVLIFTSLVRIIDLSINGLSKNLDLNILYVTRRDQDYGIHTNYTINLERIINAYNQLMVE
jgi:capsular polysaccharide biosynthesis protein